MISIDKMVDPRIQLSTPSADDLDVWTKEFLLKICHTGVNKLISNEASLEFYDCVIEGVRGYHSTVLSGIQVNEKKLAPPPKVEVNRNNIHIPH